MPSPHLPLGSGPAGHGHLLGTRTRIRVLSGLKAAGYEHPSVASGRINPHILVKLPNMLYGLDGGEHRIVKERTDCIAHPQMRIPGRQRCLGDTRRLRRNGREWVPR